MSLFIFHHQFCSILATSKGLDILYCMIVFAAPPSSKRWNKWIVCICWDGGDTYITQLNSIYLPKRRRHVRYCWCYF